MIVSANGIAQHVRITGAEDAPAALLLHGLGWDSTLWERLAEALAAAGWRAIAPDLRGAGLTDKPPQPHSIDLYAADLLALTDALGVDRFALLGFSLGGMIAMLMAALAPDRITDLIVACAPTANSDADEAATEAMLTRAAGLRPRAFARAQAKAIWHPDYAAANPAEVERFIAWRAAMDQQALTRAFRSSYGVDLRPALPGMTMRSLVVTTDADPFLDVATAEETAALLPASSLEIIRDAGHMVPVERPDLFNELIVGFLAGSPLRSAAEMQATSA